jgi:osmotically-inducible protein OsmY
MCQPEHRTCPEDSLHRVVFPVFYATQSPAAHPCRADTSCGFRPAAEPDLAVANGVVTLSGTVSGLSVKVAAVQDAHNVLGVRRVKDRLQLQSRDLPAPEELEARICRIFSHDDVLADADIEVRVTAPGKVELTGSVGNAYLKFHAQELATGAINGVTQLLNRIRHAYVLKQRPDREIRQDVQELLFWNRCVNEDMISVDVSGGVVTLTGRVDNRSEADAALSSAWAAEPGDAGNELTVTRDQACDLPPELAGTGRRAAFHPIEANRREASRQPL